MDFKPLSPTNDFVFKKVFGENMTALEDFLKAVLDLPPEEYRGLEVVDPNLAGDFFGDKHCILDVKIHTSTGKVIDAEVQVKTQSSIWNRMLFYTAKMVVEQIKSGYNYEKINRAISILIADFELVKENKAYHNRFRLYDENTGARFPDSIEINILELPKLHEADGTHLGNWLRFFRAKTEEDFMSVAETNPAIKEAWGVIKVLSGDEQARAMAEAREKARMDLEAFLSDALNEGLEKGRQEGLQEGKIEVAQNLLREKTPEDLIAKATGLPLEEIRRLAADL